MEKHIYNWVLQVLLIAGSFCLASPVMADSGPTNRESSLTRDIAPQQSSQKRLITGTVTDSKDGEPLIGASVKIKGTGIGDATDVDGKFSITVENNNQILEISYVGYATQEIKVGQRTVVDVKLVESTTLEEVVVVGFGTQKKASIVGSVQTVRPDELRVPSASLSTSFAGRLAGVIAVQRSGEPGADGASFWVRGISTFSGATSPLIIIDGVQASSADLNALPSEVIESFSVLKDATATALYGSRGANGVMIVTTKSGRGVSKPTINLRMETSLVTPTKTPKIAGGVDYMKMYNEAVKYRSTGEIPYSEEKIARTAAGYDPLLYPDVDWYSEMFKNLAVNENVNLNIRGGSNVLDYFMNVNVGHETGMLKSKSKDFFSYNSNIGLWRYVFQNNINVNLTPTTYVGLRLNAQLRDYNGPEQGANSLFGMVMEANPVDFPIYYPNGDPRNISDEIATGVAWGGKEGGRYNSGYRNPMAEMTRGYQTNFQSTIMANLELKQKLDFITKGLSVEGLFSFKNWTSSTTNRVSGYNQYEINSYKLTPGGMLDWYKLGLLGEEQEIVLKTNSDKTGDRRIYIEGKINYARIFGDHDVAAMFLYNQNEFNLNAPGNDILQALPKRKQGLAGRFSYSFKRRYLAELNFGYNGSENFAKGHRFGFFPSVALGYSISEEDFWDSMRSVFSFFKVRGNWGKVGNDEIGNERFIYMSKIDLGGKGFTTGVDQSNGKNGPVYQRYQNNNITWEVGKKVNIGLDLQLFKQINVMLDFYRENRSGIFMKRERTIPNFLGTAATDVFANLGKVRNQGFDLAVDYNKEFSKDFFLSFKGTFTFSRNKIIARDEPAFRLYPNLSSVGHQINQLSMFLAERLFIDRAEVDRSPRQTLGGDVNGGDIKYINIPNIYGEYDDMIDDNDKVYKGYPTVPEIVYGFGPSMRWKKWDMSLLFQGTARVSLMMNGFHPFGSSSIRNVLKFVADDHWSPNNQNIYAKYPALSKLDFPNNTANSTFWHRNAAFLKLKNAEFGYSDKFYRVYVSGSNLLTFSKFKHWDPEQGGGAGFSYPTQRVFNVGVQMNF